MSLQLSLIGDGWAFDEFGFTRLDQINPVVPNWSATAKTSLVSNALKVESAEWGGEAKLAMAGDDDYLAQADIQLNSGADGQLMFRYTDPDNYYALRLDDGGGVTLVKVVRGKESTVASNSYTPDTSVTAKVSVSGSTIKAWVGGSLKINTTDSTLSGGTVALAGEKAIFDNVAVGYDNNADDTIDYYVINETFGGTSITPTHDYAGNLTYDGTYRYTYDAWNRLVKATLNDTNVEVQAAVYDGLGRRVKKVVTNSGTHDGTTWYYYNGNQIIETHDGNGKLINQVYHAERARGGSVKEYIDEIVAMRTEYGRVYVHQAEGDQCGSLKDWNVIGLSDVTGRVLERYYYSPYGELEVVRDAHFFDYDGDGDVDDDDETAFTACIGETSGDCLRFDADCDGEVTEVDDGEEFGYYTATLTADTELQRVPATTVSTMGNSFGHQGLAFDVEIGSYQNRHRQYAPKMKRFMQRQVLYGIPLYIRGDNHSISLPVLYGDSTGDGAGNNAGVSPSACTIAPDPPLEGPPALPPVPSTKPSCWSDCKYWVEQERRKNNNYGWLDLLPPCPCSLPDGGNLDPALWDDPTEGWPQTDYHPNASKCIRSKLAYGASCSGQQCCYDFDNKLITSGASAGTPDRIHPRAGNGWGGQLTGPHQDVDVATFDQCKADGQIHLYLEVRPPNNADNCPANRVD